MKKDHTQYQNTLVNPLSDIGIRKARIKADIIFGSPSTGCKGAGVCTVVPAAQVSKPIKCPYATAWISIKDQARLRFAFIKDSMSEQQIKCYFRWNLFQIFESVAMPPFVQKRIASYRPLIIKPGIYIVEDRINELIVDFYLLEF